MHSEDSDQTQADLSLRWAQMPFCWFCQDEAQMLIGKNYKISISFEAEPVAFKPIVT